MKFVMHARQVADLKVDSSVDAHNPVAKPMRGGGGQSHRSAVGQPGRLRSSILFQVFPESIGESGGRGGRVGYEYQVCGSKRLSCGVFLQALRARIPGGFGSQRCRGFKNEHEVAE